MKEKITKKSAVKKVQIPAKKASQKKASKKPVITRQTHRIDAAGQVLGRLATQIAIKLRGKNKATFLPHIDAGDFVIVNNIKNIKITGGKEDKKIYYHYSGYPGGLKKTKMKDVFAKNPGEVLKRAVWNMLPKNKLRAQMIKRLKISN